MNTTEKAWEQAQLPTRMGGMGLRALEKHASAAFISSHVSSMPELPRSSETLAAAIEMYNEEVAITDQVSMDSQLNSQ